MRVVFSLLDEDGVDVDEDALRADPARARALTEDLGRSDGGLLIEDAATGMRASVGDTLPLLVRAFCMSGLEALRRDGRLDIDFFDHEETLSITVDGDQVQFDSSRFGKRRFPRDAYFADLQACGERYAAFMRSVRPADAEAAEETGVA